MAQLTQYLLAVYELSGFLSACVRHGGIALGDGGRKSRRSKSSEATLKIQGHELHEILSQMKETKLKTEGERGKEGERGEEGEKGGREKR